MTRPDPLPGDSDAEPEWVHETADGRHRQRYRGVVTYIGGSAGQRLREELVDVTADLLKWAADDLQEPDVKDARDDTTEP